MGGGREEEVIEERREGEGRDIREGGAVEKEEEYLFFDYKIRGEGGGTSWRKRLE